MTCRCLKSNNKEYVGNKIFIGNNGKNGRCNNNLQYVSESIYAYNRLSTHNKICL